MTLAFTYRGNFGANVFRSADANAPFGPNYNSRPDPALGVVRQIQSRGRQVSNALDINLKESAEHWFNGIVQYSVSHTENNTGGIEWFPANQYDDSGEYARANFDQLQRFNVLGTIHEGYWLSLGIASNLYSGTPYNETSGIDFFHTGLLNARPGGVDRNTLTTGGYANLDLRWTHDFAFGKVRDKQPAISFSADAFNVLNRTNYLTYVGNVQSEFFQQPTSALPARKLQFTLRFRF